MAVEGAGAAGVRPAPHLAHQLVAPPHSAGLGGEGQEQVELERRQVHLAPPCRDPARPAVDRQVTDGEHRGLLRGELARPVDATQQGADAGDDLAHAERLGHVVVGADPEADEQVGLVGTRREHEHRHRPLRLDPPADLEPVEAGQHEVEDDEVGRVLAVGRDRTRPVERLDDTEAFCHKAIGDGLVDRRVVLDDEQNVGAAALDDGAAYPWFMSLSLGAAARAARVRRVEIV